MDRKVRWTESAVEDLRMAERGCRVPEWSDSTVREVFVMNYRVIYQVGKNSVNILAFIHGARDLRPPAGKKGAG